MKLNKKQIFALAGIAVLSAGSFFMFRRKRIMFFDNVWCSDEECSNIDDAISYCEGNTYDSDGDGIPDSPPPGGGRSASKSTNLSSCINDQTNQQEKNAIEDVQIEIGLKDIDGNVIVNSEAEAAQLANDYATQVERTLDGDLTWEEMGYTTGMFNIVFPKPHGLKVGQKIFIVQDDTPETIGSYNGEATVNAVRSPYIIGTNKPRVGNTPAVGGYVVAPSMWDEMFG
tara:strand:+ start:10600 stop:11283 length:684 start_codon:yes stop_codon:yes gene_type:complete